MDLSKITIGIKTFLRDSHLYEAVNGIRKNLPEVKIAIVDDGDTIYHIYPDKADFYEQLLKDGHDIIIVPFDSGFGFKSNLLARMFKTDYLLIGSDDFDFSTKEVRIGITRLLSIMENNPEIDIASGRVNKRPYEFNLEDKGDVIIETVVPEKTSYNDPLGYQLCDLTVNYSLIRRRVFSKISWDDDVRIGGGEHGAFFVDVKRAGFKVAYVPGVNINEQQRESSDEYKKFRSRSRNPDRPCFDKRGIKQYVLGNGQIDYSV